MTAVDLAVLHPDTLPSGATVGEVRSYFDASDKVHMALVVDADGILLSAVTRADLEEHTPDHRLAVTIGSLGSRTIEADIPAELVAASMDGRADRRLAVVDGRGGLIGLVCRKASRSGFCTDEGVAERHTARASMAVAVSDMASSGCVRHSARAVSRTSTTSIVAESLWGSTPMNTFVM